MWELWELGKLWVWESEGNGAATSLVCQLYDWTTAVAYCAVRASYQVFFSALRCVLVLLLLLLPMGHDI